MLARLPISATSFIHVHDKDIGTIVQDIHGVDYEVACTYINNNCVKYWRLFYDPSHPRNEYIHHVHQLMVTTPSLRKKKSLDDGSVSEKMTFARFAKLIIDELKVTHPYISTVERNAIVKRLWNNQRNTV